MTDSGTASQASAVLLRLMQYCRERDWAGADPYDALNSEWLARFPLLDRRLPRLVLTQCLKRSPVNLRPLLRIPPAQNPKALALFLSASVKMARAGLWRDRQLIDGFVDNLRRQRSPGQAHACWGYSFPWQTRGVLVPRGAPNLVCTVFVAQALLDVYETFLDEGSLELALDAARYVRSLYWQEPDGSAGFAYPDPGSRTAVHNANFLAAALLGRVCKIRRDPSLYETGLCAARYSASRQRPDGAWTYGERPSQQWIDNFHTGFNLGALQMLGASACTDEFEPRLQRGFRFYLRHFIRDDGAPRYFHNRTYPVDTHSAAQTLITLTTLRALAPESAGLARAVFRWTMQYLWSPRGYFHYRAYPFLRIRTSYMRWSQAWMALALATLLEETLEP